MQLERPALAGRQTVQGLQPAFPEEIRLLNLGGLSQSLAKRWANSLVSGRSEFAIAAS